MIISGKRCPGENKSTTGQGNTIFPLPLAPIYGSLKAINQLREFEMRMELDAAANIVRSATVTNPVLLIIYKKELN